VGQKVPTVPAFLPMESAPVPALPLPLCSSLPSHPSFLNPLPPFSQRIQERGRICRICCHLKGSLVYEDLLKEIRKEVQDLSYLFLFQEVAGLCRPTQKESKRGMVHVVFVLIFRGGWFM
jgi:hypothetical protein